MADSEQRLPPNRIRSDTKLKCSAIINATDIDDVIFHARGEAGALQCCTPNSLEELVVEIDRISVTVNSLLQEFDKFNGCLVKQISVVDGDVINHVPRILLIVSQVHRNI